MRSRLPLLLLVLLACAAASRAQEGTATRSGRDAIWRRGIESAAGLEDRIDRLAAALRAGDARAILALAGPGAIKLQIHPLGMPAVLTGKLQARAMLRDYLDWEQPIRLRVAQARLTDDGGIARVALEMRDGPSVGGRPLRHRFVAGFMREGEDWLLTELRCP